MNSEERARARLESAARKIAAQAIATAGLDVDLPWLLARCREEWQRGCKTLPVMGYGESYIVTIASGGSDGPYFPTAIEHSTRGTLWRYFAREDQ